MADHPEWFANTNAQLDGGLSLYAVNVPAITASTCDAASRAAPH
jgi:hypothetical protein